MTASLQGGRADGQKLSGRVAWPNPQRIFALKVGSRSERRKNRLDVFQAATLTEFSRLMAVRFSLVPLQVILKGIQRNVYNICFLIQNGCP